MCRLLHLKIISLKKPLQIGLCNKAQCNCIYNSLEKHYSPQFVENLPKVSLQNINANMHFVETMNETMHQCQLSARKDSIN
ncbi:hypothetical protein [Acinetobacter pittii]|uniref:hypothetical protein n=1 Tax=Acinetobacter pittii TaxID=48296 RepID=UPI0039761304